MAVNRPRRNLDQLELLKRSTFQVLTTGGLYFPLRCRLDKFTWLKRLPKFLCRRYTVLQQSNPTGQELANFPRKRVDFIATAREPQLSQGPNKKVPDGFHRHLALAP